MSKIKHYLEENSVYFITAVTKNRKPIFNNRWASCFLLATIGYFKYICDFKLFGYVVMPEHFHFLIQPSLTYNLPKIMNYIKGNYARKYNLFFRKKGHVWQEQYWDTAMRNEKDVIKWLNYMHNNPVVKGLVNEPDKYEFSSYLQYQGKIRQLYQIQIDKIY